MKRTMLEKQLEDSALRNPVNILSELLKHRKCASIHRWLVFLAALVALLLPISVSLSQGQQASDVLPKEFADQVPQEFKDRIALLSGQGVVIAAKAFGVTEIVGVPIAKEPGEMGSETEDQDQQGVPIGANPNRIQDEPTVAANPKDSRNLVAGMHSIIPGVRCVAFNSFDGGQTWSGPITMPQLTRNSQCSDPVLAFAPDGSRVYYAYMDIRFEFTPSPPTFTQELNIVVNFSDDGGRTWLPTPVIALKGEPTIFRFNPFSVTPGFDYDKPWITAPIDDRVSSFVYVTATRFDNVAPFRSHIAFTRSDTRGAQSSWMVPTLLDTSPKGSFPPPIIVVQGSRPAGGMGGNVLVAWYNSNGPDILPGVGITPPPDPIGWLNNSFIIRTRASSNFGTTFGPIVNASVDSFEAPFFLGPFGSFHRWWPTMFPAVKIARDGSAHLVYTYHPVRNNVSCFFGGTFCSASSTPEDGDIRYTTSDGPPYLAWSAPVTVNDDGLPRAQGFASVAVREEGEGEAKIHVTFFDTRRSPFSNVLYDVFGTTKQLRESRFRENFRVSDKSSISQFSFIGDYFDLASSGDLVFQVWTDRRKHLDDFIFVSQSDVFGIRVKED